MTLERRLSSPLILPPRLYGHRTSSVRVLSVAASSLALHTGYMAVNAEVSALTESVEPVDKALHE